MFNTCGLGKKWDILLVYTYLHASSVEPCSLMGIKGPPLPVQSVRNVRQCRMLQ